MTAAHDGAAGGGDGGLPLVDDVLHAVGAVGSTLGSTLGDLVPVEARNHLVKAQCELILAVVCTIEHYAGIPRKSSRRRASGSSRRGARGGGGAAAERGSRTPQRVAID